MAPPSAKKRKLESSPIDGYSKSLNLLSPSSSSGASKTPTTTNPQIQSSTPAPQFLAFSDQLTENIEEEEDEEENGELFCICRKPDNHTWMIACDGVCEDWYHGKCVGIEQDDGKLIDKYICSKCEGDDKGNTTWKPMCRLDGCRNPARISETSSSKYCSEEHGKKFMLHWLSQLETTFVNHKHLVNKINAQNIDVSTVSRLLGGELTKGDLATLIKDTKGVEAFKRLGDVIYNSSASASLQRALDNFNLLPTTRQNCMQYMLDEIEQAQLQKITKRNEQLQQRKAGLESREIFLNVVKEKSKRLFGELDGTKGTCGYDSRLSWSEEELSVWHCSNQEEKLLGKSHNSISTFTKLDQTGSVKLNDNSSPEVCLKKRCERHKNWRIVQLQDIRFELLKVAEEIRKLVEKEDSLYNQARLRCAYEGNQQKEEYVEAVAD
ncbi:MAG: hypothetical protein M1829_001845 [Trizodia sp. TS-e1964]|nr:MAG: hypothetical protein M1829_001845 [Trizodia sp. TS-e1964]